MTEQTQSTNPAAGDSAGSIPPASLAPAASPRPDQLPETFWDAQSGAVKPEFWQHYAQTAGEAEKIAALKARKPEDIKIEVKLPDTVKVPEGVQLKIDEKDPRVPVLRAVAHEFGMPQEAVDKLVSLDAQMKLEAINAETTRLAEEDKKLGANADARKAAVGNWFKGLRDKGDLTAQEHEALVAYATDAAAITALEKIIAKANGSVPSTAGNDRPAQPEPKTAAQRIWGNGFNSTPQARAS